MGNACASKHLFPHEANAEISDAESDAEDPQGEVHMVICGLDYACDRRSWAGPPPNGNGPLDTRYAFDMMIELAQKSGATTIRPLWNEQCTKENIARNIAEVGALCGEEDYFIFYYTGHGDRLPSQNDDEAEDNCFCTVGPDGATDDAAMQYRTQVWWRDDDFAKCLLDAVSIEAKILVLADCCHSGSICDFTEDSEWAKRKQRAISISGCEDTETSAGTGKGGMFTRAMTRAIQDLQGSAESYMVSNIYNKIQEEYQANKTAGHTQHITIHGCVTKPKEMVWPLQPTVPYVSPANAGLR
eukprot:CAMPEP_0170623928 /NCGR_PEP_ID=MMETSP0224-20130122/29960_1 /TAXON_ID=285029 /ORGANISM="Togula jolla, Strain CCCM 725" /LENGTH=299 /DNA_ID=CAMNT_0010950415 /DNA_START=71 /DNA_END=970 /DNA_ORIENTATION=+